MKNVRNQLSERPDSKMIGLGANPTENLRKAFCSAGLPMFRSSNM